MYNNSINSNLNQNQQLANYWPPLMQNDANNFSSVRQQVVVNVLILFCIFFRFIIIEFFFKNQSLKYKIFRYDKDDSESLIEKLTDSLLSKQKSVKAKPIEIELQTFDFNHGLSSSTVKTSYLTLFQSNQKLNGSDDFSLNNSLLPSQQQQQTLPPSLLSLNVDPTRTSPLINKNQASSALFPILKNNQPMNAQ